MTSSNIFRKIPLSGILLLFSSTIFFSLNHHTKANLSRSEIDSTDCTSNPWVSTEAMNTPRTQFAAIQSNGYIYALGGYLTSELASIERASINTDGSLNSWEVMTSTMTSPRAGLAAVTADGYIYAIGGIGDGPHSDVERAKINSDGSLGAWDVLTATMSTHKYLSGAILVNGTIYVMGGVYTGTISSVEYTKINLDGTLSPWITTSSMKVPRDNFAVAQANGYLYAIGGQVNPSSSVERAIINSDGSLGTWQITTPLSTFRAALEALSLDGYIYIFGGVNGNTLDSVERAVISNSNGTLGSWESVTPMLTARSSFAIIQSGSYIYALGGTDYSPLDSVEYADVSSLRPSTTYQISINQGALFTNNTDVSLTIGAKAGTTEMQISNDGGFAGAIWEPCVSPKPWTITQYGSYVIPRIVYIRFKDQQGNISTTYQDDIILDVTPPVGSLTISPSLSAPIFSNRANALYKPPGPMFVTETGITYTLYLPFITKGQPCPPMCIPNATLHPEATDDVSGVGDMLISNSIDFSDAQWEPFTTSKQWYIPAGLTSVYAKFRDNAGNISDIVTGNLVP